MINRTHWLPNRQSIIGLTALLALGVLAIFARPDTVSAQSRCPLPPRLATGDAVEVIDGTANRLRYGPGLGYGWMSLSMAPGVVWNVDAGPVCANGINWYRVAAHDAFGWTAEGEYGKGYYLGRTNRLPTEGQAATACSSNRLVTGMQVMVGDGARQHVRAAASKQAGHIGWLAPRIPVTIVNGPRCADGWVWWYITDGSGRLQGWTSEGDGPYVPWLVPAWGPAGTGGNAPGSTVLGSFTRAATSDSDSVVNPTFAGTYRTNGQHMGDVSFSEDGEAVTFFYDDFQVRTGPRTYLASASRSVTLPVRSGPKGYLARPNVWGTIECPAGALASVTMRVGAVSDTVSCSDELADLDLIVEVVQPANSDLNITITAQVWKFSPQAEPMIAINLIDIGLEPR